MIYATNKKDSSVKFKIYFYADSNIVVSKFGPVRLSYDPTAEPTTKIIVNNVEYNLNSKEILIFLNNEEVQGVNVNAPSQQGEVKVVE